MNSYKKNFEVHEGRTTAIGNVRLNRGSRVSGIVLRLGQPVPRAKVSIRSSAPRMSLCSLQTVLADKDGRFSIPRRLPTGDYKINAQRTMGLENSPTGMVEARKSEMMIKVFAGQNNTVTILIPQS